MVGFAYSTYQVKYTSQPTKLKVSIGDPAPNFALSDLSGQTWSLAELRGTNVVIDFWATWCSPCKVSLPHLQRFYTEMQASNVVVLAVSIDDTSTNLAEFARLKHLSFPILWDKDQKVAERYGVEAIPTTILIGKTGKVRYVEEGLDPYLTTFLKSEIESQEQEKPHRRR
jgi:peroxiredoxin